MTTKNNPRSPENVQEFLDALRALSEKHKIYLTGQSVLSFDPPLAKDYQITFVRKAEEQESSCGK